MDFRLFTIIWVSLGICLFVFLTFNRNAKLKQKVFPLILIITGVIFNSFIFLSGAPLQFLIITIPFTAIIIFANYKTIIFCESCGRTIYNRAMFTKVKYCPSCNKEFQPDIKEIEKNDEPESSDEWF